MTGSKTRGALALIIMIGTGKTAMAGDLAVGVMDTGGRPVQHAVISLRALDGQHAAQPAGTMVIDQQGKQFTPWVVAATAGSAVGFSNHDDITHHVYSFSPARRFSFRLQSGEQHEPLDLDQAGVVVIGCNIHDWMVGYIHVTDADATGTTDAAGIARFTGLAPGNWTVTLWHPGLTDVEPPAQAVQVPATGTVQLPIRLAHVLRETGPREPLGDNGYALP